MNLSDYKADLLLQLSAEPQRQAKASQAIAGIEAGIGELAALGYRFACVEALSTHTPEPPQEYPKMLYRSGEYPFDITVEDEDGEREALERGYAGRGEAMKALEPAVNSEPKNPIPGENFQAPKPALTDKEVLDKRIDAGSGASIPSQPVAQAAAKVAS